MDIYGNWVIEVKNLHKQYNGIRAVSGLNFKVRYGEIHGLLGPNGAGKTTTLKIIVGLIKKDGGEVKVFGKDIDKDPYSYKKHIGYLPEYPELPLYLTVEEFIRYVGKIRDVPDDILNKRINDFLEIFEISNRRDELIANLSQGMKQKVAIIASLIHRPRLVILDEPFIGIDPMGQKIIKDLLVSWVESGSSILVSTHALDTAERLCDTVTIINNGVNIATGTLEELRSKAKAKKGSTLEEIFIKLLEKKKAKEF